MDYEVGEVTQIEGKRYIVVGYAVEVCFDGEPQECRIYRLMEEGTGNEITKRGEVYKHNEGVRR